jgi:hypothetical protein
VALGEWAFVGVHVAGGLARREDACQRRQGRPGRRKEDDVDLRIPFPGMEQAAIRIFRTRRPPVNPRFDAVFVKPFDARAGHRRPDDRAPRMCPNLPVSGAVCRAAILTLAPEV